MNFAMTERALAAAKALNDKVSLITGSTSGIGLGIARALAAAGSAVVLNGFGNQEEIKATQASIGEDFGVPVAYSAADMTKPEQIAEMVQMAIDMFGSVDVLVNNAGIQHVAPLQDFPVAKWDAIIAINLSSAFHTTRLALPSMLAKKWGRIINIASAHGLVGSPFKSAYVAAKHGMLGLTKVTALETAGRGADRGPGQGPRHSARASDPRRAARPAAQQALRHHRRARRHRRVPRLRHRSVNHRELDRGGWRLDRALSRKEQP